TLQATGGTSPYTWSLASGSLPAGLALSTSGTISGMPSTSGTSSFSVMVKDSESTPQSVTGALTLAIAAATPAPAALKITSTTLAGGTEGSSYSTTLQATGGTSPYTWSLASGSLPAGLALSTSGTISGMPSTSGTSSFSVTVKDSESTPQSVTGALTLAIAATTTPPSGSGTLATAYSSLISANYTAKSSYTSANTYYVSTGGSDSNAGTSSAPWATIAHAASTVSGCALVLVDPGTYTVSSGRTAKITNSGTSACHTAYVATAYASSILNTADNNANDPAVWITGSYVDMVGFDINNPMGCMGVYSNGSYINLTYNRVHDVANGSGAYSCGNGVGGGGILGAIGASNYNNWSDNIVWNVGTIGNHYTHGLYTTSSYNTIQNNIVYNAGGACIQAYHQPSHDIITNNTLVGCGYNGFLFGADSGYSFSNSVFSNNAMYGNSGYDIDACGASGCGVAIGSGNTFSNNDTASSGGNSTGDLSSVGESLVSNITGNPEFVDVASPASGGNFDVASGSPVITAGTSKNAPATDILGVTRNTADPSIGAYEDAN
ncbi:MAG: putative Ig domain-containing protein, partial [Candidatus Korobacteraceae bacterium]